MVTKLEDDGIRKGSKLWSWSELVEVIQSLGDHLVGVNAAVFIEAAGELEKWLKLYVKPARTAERRKPPVS